MIAMPAAGDAEVLGGDAGAAVPSEARVRPGLRQPRVPRVAPAATLATEAGACLISGMLMHPLAALYICT